MVGISYEDDIDKAKTILQELAAKDPRILKEPATTIAVAELADSSVNLVFRPWVKTKDYWAVRFDLTEKIKKTFDQETRKESAFLIRASFCGEGRREGRLTPLNFSFKSV